MRTAWHEIWGCASGPAAKLAPQVRIVAGAGVFAACMIAPTSTLLGGIAAVAVASCWLCACWPPLRVVRAILILGLVVLLPYFLLAPFIDPGRGVATHTPPLAIVAGLFVRGMTGLLASVATVAVLSASDLREGLVRLPVPSLVSAILLQIVHQTAMLAYETHRVSSAISVRAASAGAGTAWRMLASLPRVWLPRIVCRAERVAAAMEIRGFCEGDLEGREPIRVRLLDGVALALVAAALVLAVAVRYLRMR